MSDESPSPRLKSWSFRRPCFADAKSSTDERSRRTSPFSPASQSIPESSSIAVIEAIGRPCSRERTSGWTPSHRRTRPPSSTPTHTPPPDARAMPRMLALAFAPAIVTRSSAPDSRRRMSPARVENHIPPAASSAMLHTRSCASFSARGENFSSRQVKIPFSQPSHTVPFESRNIARTRSVSGAGHGICTALSPVTRKIPFPAAAASTVPSPRFSSEVTRWRVPRLPSVEMMRRFASPPSMTKRPFPSVPARMRPGEASVTQLICEPARLPRCPSGITKSCG